ncbi:MAG: carbohydrate kinase family protein [Firmicutes bacterium]|nr:carbohydrate kinase family protein [Bacillota bacterium]
MRISGVGCCVVDYIYQDIDFTSPGVKRYLCKDGSNGLMIGEGNLSSHLTTFFGKSEAAIIEDITGGRTPHKVLGGVSIVTLVSAAQLLFDRDEIDVYYYANIPDNEPGSIIMDTVGKTPLRTDKIQVMEGDSVVTHALCGNDLDGNPSRTFICAPCVHPSTALQLEQLDHDFYASELTVFSAIQWEPEISGVFTEVLKRCKEAGSITIVSTASDPLMRGKTKWVLGDSDAVYEYIDILIMNKEEALNYSGTRDLHSAVDYFKSFPSLGGILVTDGLNPTYVYGRGKLCLPYEGFIPIVVDIDQDKQRGLLPEGDTVGCGDNYCGGVVASVALQLGKQGRPIDLVEACILGSLSGGITSTITGGIFKETHFGQKRGLMEKYHPSYVRQVREFQARDNTH